MNHKLASTLAASAVGGTATLLAWGLLATPSASAAEGDLAKREEDRVDLVLVDDRDDDDTNDDTGTGSSGNTGNSGTGNSNDGTNSRSTGVSRDRDHSRGDKTRDWTNDGPATTSATGRRTTNDRSRNVREHRQGHQTTAAFTADLMHASVAVADGRSVRAG